MSDWSRGILSSKYRRPRKSFARKAGRRVFRKAPGSVRRALRHGTGVSIEGTPVGTVGAPDK
jgi:hypothetical protein